MKFQVGLKFSLFPFLWFLRKNENRCLLSNTLATFIHLWTFQNEAHFSPWRFQASKTCQQILHRQRSVRFLNCKVLSSPGELYALSVSCMNKQRSQYTHHLWYKMLCAPPWIASNETLMGFHCYVCYTHMSVSVMARLCLWYRTCPSFHLIVILWVYQRGTILRPPPISHHCPRKYF